MTERDNFVTCGICLENTDKLLDLPCFHTACFKCVENIVGLTVQNGEMECPSCRNETINEEGATGFRGKRHIISSDSVSCNNQVDCDTCVVKTAATNGCKQCDQYFCKSCSDIHIRMTASRFHTLDSISPRQKIKDDRGHEKVYCKNHTSNEVSDVCLDCNEFICTACVPLFHKDHLCKSLSTVADEKRNKLKELITVSENNLTEIEKDTCVVKRQAKSKHSFFNEQIFDMRKTKDTLITKINQKYKLFEEKIKLLNDEQLLKSDQMNNAQQMIIENFKKTIEHSRETLETSENILLLKNFESVCTELSVIKEELAPAVSGKALMENVERCTTWLVNLNSKCDEL